MPDPYMGKYSAGIIGVVLLLLGYLTYADGGGYYRGVSVSKWVGLPILLYGILLIVFQLYKLIKQRR